MKIVEIDIIEPKATVKREEDFNVDSEHKDPNTGFYVVSNLCQRIVDNVYLVKNQNGFNHALYDVARRGNFLLEDGEECSGYRWKFTKKEIRETVQIAPGIYPCLITIDMSFREVTRTYVNICHPGMFAKAVAQKESWISKC